MPFSGPASASISGRSIASPTSDTLVTFSFSIGPQHLLGHELAVDDDPLAEVEADERGQGGGAVHQRRSGEEGDARRRRRRPARRAPRGRFTGSPVGAPPPSPAKNRSSWRHITPLGMPVVPPV